MRNEKRMGGSEEDWKSHDDITVMGMVSNHSDK